MWNCYEHYISLYILPLSLSLSPICKITIDNSPKNKNLKEHATLFKVLDLLVYFDNVIFILYTYTWMWGSSCWSFLLFGMFLINLFSFLFDNYNRGGRIWTLDDILGGVKPIELQHSDQSIVFKCMCYLLSVRLMVKWLNSSFPNSLNFWDNR